MKRTNKKGFTIVELVIVIAVIAILAAVLIPNISSLVKKANQSADIQACRQMNTYLAMNEVTEGKDITKVYTALEEGGMNAEKYKPLTNDTYYFWDSELNRILYTDANEKVLFPEEYKNVKSTDHQWYSLTKEIKGDKNYTSTNGTITVSSGAQLYQAVQDFAISETIRLNSSGTETQKFENSILNDTTIELTADVDMKGASLNIGYVAEGKTLTIKGNGHNVKGVSNLESAVNDAKLNSEQKYRNYYCGLIQYVGDNAKVNFENITFDGLVIGNTKTGSSGLLIGKVAGSNAEITIKGVKIRNSTLYGKNKLGAFIGAQYGSGCKVNVKDDTCLENVNIISTEGESGILFGSTADGGTNNSIRISKALINSADFIKNCSVSCTSEKMYKVTPSTGFNATLDGCVVEKADATNQYRPTTAYFGFAGTNGKAYGFTSSQITSPAAVGNFNPINTYEQAVAAGWVYDFVEDSRVVNN